MSHQEIDYQIFRSEIDCSFREIWNPSENFSRNLLELIPKFVVLPKAKLQLPILASYLSHFTPLCSILPIAFAIGAAGTGKSTIGILAASIYNSNPLNASSSPAAVRNECCRLRFNEDGNERPYLLVWDDLKTKNLLDFPTVYAILRGGYNRKTDQVSIASADGTNRLYRVFGGRVLSSIEAIFNHPKMGELQRRCLPIVCKKFSSFSREEALEAGILDPNWTIEDKLDPLDFNWDGLFSEFQNQWDDPNVLSKFGSSKKKLTQSKKLKDQLGDKYTISRDLIATGVATGIFQNLEEAVEIFSKYWKEVAEPQFSDLSATAQAIQAFLEEVLAPIREANQLAGYELIPEAVSPEQLNSRLKLAASKGELDTTIHPREIAEIMHSLGWKLQHLKPPSCVTGMHWVKSIS